MLMIIPHGAHARIGALRWRRSRPQRRDRGEARPFISLMDADARYLPSEQGVARATCLPAIELCLLLREALALPDASAIGDLRRKPERASYSSSSPTCYDSSSTGDMCP